MTLCSVSSPWGNLFYKDDYPPSEKVRRNDVTAAQWEVFLEQLFHVFFSFFFFFLFMNSHSSAKGASRGQF